MKTRLVALAIVLTAFSLARAGEMPTTMPAGKAAPAFDLLKTLAGKWKAVGAPAGTEPLVTYQVLSNNTVLLETMGCDAGNMVSVYHADGDRLMMTHYCAVGNQPRMRADEFKAGDKTITFNFVDATNLPDPTAGHMHKVVYTFEDPDHVTATWTFYKDNKPAGDPTVIKLERDKSGK